MIDILKQIVKDTNTRVLGQVLLSKKHSELLTWIMEESKMLDSNITIKERVWYILNGKQNVVCPEGKKKTFNPKTTQYGFCGNVKDCVCFQQHLSEQRKGMDMSHVVEKRVATWEKKYGVKNVSQHHDIKQKRIESINKNPKIKDIYKKLAYEKESKGFVQILDRLKSSVIPLFERSEYCGSRIQNKYKWKCIQCENEFIDYVDSGRTPVCKICYPNSISSGELELRAYIQSLGISKVETNVRNILNGLEYDIYLPDYNLAFEYNGVYWHSDIFKNKKYHVKKYLLSLDNGIQLINIFEDEWKNKKEIIKSRIKSLVGISNKIHARKCCIREITNSLYKEFVESNHLQGYAYSSHRYGLFHGDILVAVMSFSKSRYTNEGYEMIRFCSKLGTNVVGGASKLFKNFINKVNPNLIVSYANRCWSNGNLYITLGFKNQTEKLDNVGYWYIKNDIRYHRSTFTKKRLLKIGADANLTEAEIMGRNGFLRIYDCGNNRFVWRKI